VGAGLGSASVRDGGRWDGRSCGRRLSSKGRGLGRIEVLYWLAEMG
jgi:hypothetical protein